MAEAFETIDKLSSLNIPKEVVDKIPPRLCKEYNIFPIEETESYFKIAMVNPYDIQAIDDIQLIIKKKVKPVKTTPEEIESAIKKYFGVGAGTFKFDKTEEEAEESTSMLDSTGPEEIDVVEAAEDAVVVNFVNQIMKDAVKTRATDIHIEPLPKDIRIRYRIDGVLKEVPIPSQMKRYRMAIISRVKIMAKMDIAERRLPQDQRIAITTEGKNLDLRVSTLPIVDGESIAIRLLDKSAKLYTLEDVGMFPHTLEIMNNLTKHVNGIILITGPTGSGKSTTLAALLHKINSPGKNIITVEDPVEYQIPGINQVQANERIGLTFATVLRSILRHDPNVVMIGEIRDAETAEIAMRAALTGHLVLSTIHTNDAPSAVTRLIDMGMEPFLVSSTIRGVLAQRLARAVCPHCKNLYSPSAEEIAQYKIPISNGEKPTFAKGKGCDWCNDTGYFGRMGIFELFVMTESIEDLILQKAPASSVRVAAKKGGMVSLREDAWMKVKKGLITIEEVFRVTPGETYGG